eukprot:7302569-Alexandrium_andersonii.AAC.1
MKAFVPCAWGVVICAAATTPRNCQPLQAGRGNLRKHRFAHAPSPWQKDQVHSCFARGARTPS